MTERSNQPTGNHEDAQCNKNDPTRPGKDHPVAKKLSTHQQAKKKNIDPHDHRKSYSAECQVLESETSQQLGTVALAEHLGNGKCTTVNCEKERIAFHLSLDVGIHPFELLAWIIKCFGHSCDCANLRPNQN